MNGLIYTAMHEAEQSHELSPEDCAKTIYSTMCWAL